MSTLPRLFSAALACGLLVLSTVVNAEIQPKAKSAASKSQKAPAREVAPAPEPPAAPQFEPVFLKPDLPMTAYRDNDVEKTWLWLKSKIDAVPRKPDQFSTSAEKHVYEDAVTATIRSFGQVVLHATACPAKYNADAGQWEIKRAIFMVDKYDLPQERRSSGLRQVLVGLKNIQNDSYEGQNAYGAKTQISRTRADQYAVQFPYDSENAPTSAGRVSSGGGTQYEVVSLDTQVPMEPSKARENDKKLQCAYVVTLKPPVVYEYVKRTTPTRDLPFETDYKGHAFFGSLDQVIVYHADTGEIYNRVERK
jgi:hypothetical protein